MLRSLIRRGLTASTALSLVFILGIGALPAVAQTATVSQTVSCTSYYLAQLTVINGPTAVNYRTSSQSTSAKLELQAGFASTCQSNGWKVTLVASNLVASGVSPIDASNIRAASLSTVRRLYGSLPVPSKGMVSNTPLNTPVAVMDAAKFTASACMRRILTSCW